MQLISLWPWNFFEQHVFPLFFLATVFELHFDWANPTFCPAESYIIEGDFALTVISCVLWCCQCSW